jgi:levansucrase
LSSAFLDQGNSGEVLSAHWRSDAELATAVLSAHALPIISASQVRLIAEGFDYWDMWPLTYQDGTLVSRGQRSWWFYLAAEKCPDPESRHDFARIHLVSRERGEWRDHGPVIPPELSPGSREWSGSSVLGSDGTTVTLYFTAAGRRDGGPRFEQRLFVTSGIFEPAEASSVSNWTQPVEFLTADGDIYASAQDDAPRNGMIAGFRDPTYFCDSETGSEYVLFTGNSGRTRGDYNGLIGLAQRTATKWVLLPPLLDATGLNHEMERAHVVEHDGLYYLFWSTHAARFAPDQRYPTGLYGMVSKKLRGPWRPLNGHSLVACNPLEEPSQAYCWWVTDNLEVASFVNYWGLQGRSTATDIKLARRCFGGAPAPVFKLKLQGDRATIE